jgi:lactose/L-arabinose transport system permease protein
MVLTVVMVPTWAFQMFVQPYMMTQGGPDYATSTITYYLYKQAFNSYNIGYGSCIAVIGVVIFLAIIQLEKYLMRDR